MLRATKPLENSLDKPTLKKSPPPPLPSSVAQKKYDQRHTTKPHDQITRGRPAVEAVRSIRRWDAPIRWGAQAPGAARAALFALPQHAYCCTGFSPLRARSRTTTPPRSYPPCRLSGNRRPSHRASPTHHTKHPTSLEEAPTKHQKTNAIRI